MRRYLSFFLLFVMLTAPLLAQDICVDFDKKVIHTDSLHMPGATTAYSVLTLLPELLQRPGVTLLTNYDIQVEDMTVGQAADVALNQLTLDDIERIEVKESPLDSYNKNGVGGVINIVLRQHGSRTDSIWGSVGVTASYPMDIAPHLLLGHRQDKLMVRGLIINENYHNSTYSEAVTYDAAHLPLNATRTDNAQRYYTELARLYMQYTPTAADRLQFNVAQSFVHDAHATMTNRASDQTATTRSQTNNLHAQVKYDHTWDRAKLVGEVQYQYNPSDYTMQVPDIQDYAYQLQLHKLSGKVEAKGQLTRPDQHTQLSLITGCNVNAVFGRGDEQSELHESHLNLSVQYGANTQFVQPYATIELSSGPFRLKATGEYQFYHSDMYLGDSAYTATAHDWTAKLIAEWHPVAHHNLRLIADRKLQRPSEAQLYPELSYDIEHLYYVQGNPYLRPVLSHELRLDYVSDLHFGEHHLDLNASVGYIHISDIIKEYQAGGQSASGGLGMTLPYHTYTNDGVSHVANSYAMLLYRYRAFSLGVTGNVYHKDMANTSPRNHYTYCNVAIHPQVSFASGWQGGVQAAYFSRVRTQQGTQGGCTILSCMLGKRWRGLYVYLYDRLALPAATTDITSSADNTIETTANSITNMAGLGLKYIF